MGFPKATMTPLAAGGRPPYGEDMNGILAMLSIAARASEAGLLRPFSADFANAIGGYPRGATVAHPSAQGRFLICVMDGNTNDPGNSMTGWVDPLAGFLPVSNPAVQGTLTTGYINAPNNGGQTMNLSYGPGLACRVALQNDGNLVLYNGDRPFLTVSPTVLAFNGQPVVTVSALSAETARAQAAESALLPVSNPAVQGTLTTGYINAPNNGGQTMNLSYGPGLACRVALQNDGNLVLYNGDRPFLTVSPTVLAFNGQPVVTVSALSAETARAQAAESALLPVSNPAVQGTLTTGYINAPNNGGQTMNLSYGPGLACRVALQNDGNLVLYNGGQPFLTASPKALTFNGQDVVTSGSQGPKKTYNFDVQASHGQQIDFPEPFSGDAVSVVPVAQDTGNNRIHIAAWFQKNRNGFQISINVWTGSTWANETAQVPVTISVTGPA
ncbi:hypothetical protein GM609_06775 [Bombella sp. ESL0387]|nr:hypothetical protein [Bombella sp. ESL0387]